MPYDCGGNTLWWTDAAGRRVTEAKRELRSSSAVVTISDGCAPGAVLALSWGYLLDLLDSVSPTALRDAEAAVLRLYVGALSERADQHDGLFSVVVTDGAPSVRVWIDSSVRRLGNPVHDALLVCCYRVRTTR
ncbi:hypothetical protein ACIQWN_32345 [Streptomyces vinaceus]|uniref:hypothetical protein n=1 Tax=Streptomyces vinaceus TaxID=1960 RepID=UPI003827067F